MTDNRFADCTTVNDVLWRYHECARDGETEYGPPALARIAELSPRTVDAAGRERVREIVSGWVDGMQCHAVTDRIIDALGYAVAPQPKPVLDGEARSRFNQVWGELYTFPRPLLSEFQMLVAALGWTAAEPERCQCADVRDDCCERTPAPAPPAPVVELDARAKVTDLNVDDLETLRDRLNEWPPIASGLGISERHAIPTDIGWIVHDGRAWVLRIAGATSEQ